MSEELTLQDALTALRMKLEAFAATVEAEVKALDGRWRGGDKDLMRSRRFIANIPMSRAGGSSSGSGDCDGDGGLGEGSR